mmetsp:Transcript_3621/g.4025  ORF Transcript_3621/g.4025 Transcript_3621/m.4025 type:complete len:88 (-) Transcript_3621:229-492(-)
MKMQTKYIRYTYTFLQGNIPAHVQSPPNRSSSTIKTDLFSVPLANFAAVNPAAPPPTTIISYENSDDDDDNDDDGNSNKEQLWRRRR